MPARRPLDLAGDLIDRFDHGLRVTEYLIGVLSEEVWQALPPGDGRPIAAIVAHMQGLRRSFAKMGGAEQPGPALESGAASREEAVAALAQSREALVGVIRGALERGEGRVKGLPRRTVDVVTYLLQHDAHHRGQITWQARELGQRLEDDDVMRLWGWKKLP